MTTDPGVVYPAAVRPYDGAWAGLDDARMLWPDAALIDDDTLTVLLAASNGDCRQYAPAAEFVAADAERQAQLTTAVVYHARDIWIAGRADPDGNTMGPAGVFVPRPLSAQVRTMLRPPRGPMIG